MGNLPLLCDSSLLFTLLPENPGSPWYLPRTVFRAVVALAYSQQWNPCRSDVDAVVPQQFEQLPQNVVTGYENMDIGIVHFDLDVRNSKSNPLLFFSLPGGPALTDC